MTQLTDQQRRFAQAYVATGGKGSAAVRSAYPASKNPDVIADQLLHNEAVLGEIKRLVDTRIRASIAKAADQLEHLMEHAKGGASGDNVKLKAAEALLDRGGLLVARYSEVHHTVEHVPPKPIADLLLAEFKRAAAAGLISIGDAPKLLTFLAEQDQPIPTMIDVTPERTEEPALLEEDWTAI
jgi:phage terminase small subunit